MSAQKRLSQLSIAAVVLLVVSVPAFAQTESTAKNTAAGVSDNSAIVAVNRESVTGESRVEEKRVADADVNSKAPKFSATMFVKAASEATAKPSIFFHPVADRFERKESRPVNGITFVASRGQTLPE